jgi:hypothetical protein
MSHFFTLALIEPEVVRRSAQAIKNKIAQVMALHSVQLREDETPGAKWDSWQIGGRYDGLIMRGESGTAAVLSGPDDLDDTLRRNMRLVHDLADDLVPFAVVLPDGTCHFEGVMEEFGYSSSHDPYWEDRYDAPREQYAECWAGGLDCHI